jgi:hypothetical protein
MILRTRINGMKTKQSTSAGSGLLLAMTLAVGFACAGEVTVEWANWDDNHLYDAAGVDMRAQSNRFQLVFDVNGDTDIGAMISNGCWTIGAEAAGTASYGADDDVTVPAQNASWTLYQNWGSVDSIGRYEETLYASTRFYFRFFNATELATATEGGLVYNTADTWVTATSALALEQAVADLARTGAAASVLAGSTEDMHLDGWATMRSGPMDRDRDGLPDEWENLHLGGTNAVPGIDSDADGLSDGDEYLAGTNPTNAADVFAVSIGRTNAVPMVWFTALEAAGPGYSGQERYYDLQSSSNLVSTPWRGVPDRTNILGRQQVVAHSNATGRATLFRVKARLE